MQNFEFKNIRPLTRSMLTWWAFEFEKQEIPTLNTLFDIEHIFARKRQENDRTLSNVKNLEALGNKVLLEFNINIRAADYRFQDKLKYYRGFTNDKGQYKSGTFVAEISNQLCEKIDFTEKDIIERTEKIIDSFLLYLEKQNLIKN